MQAAEHCTRLWFRSCSFGAIQSAAVTLLTQGAVVVGPAAAQRPAFLTLVRQAHGPACVQLEKGRGTAGDAGLQEAARPVAREERALRIMEADMVATLACC